MWLNSINILVYFAVMYITERHANMVYVFLNGIFVVIRRTQACILTKTSSKDIAHILLLLVIFVL